MSEEVFIRRAFRPAPLARDEADLVERLRAMAEDALARKDEDAVDREVEVARVLLGLKR